jgi:hypothetical protein
MLERIKSGHKPDLLKFVFVVNALLLRNVALTQMLADLGAGQAAVRRTKDVTDPLENCIV